MRTLVIIIKREIVHEPMGSVGTIQGGQFYHAFPERYMSIDCILA